MDYKYKLLVKNEFGKVKEIIANKNENLLDVLKTNDITIENSCNGKGKCGKCKVKIISKNIPCSSQDTKHISKEKLDEGYRLSCTLKINNDLEIIIPSSKDDMKVLIDGIEEKLEVDPIIKKEDLTIGEPSLDDQRSSHKRLMDSLNINNLEVDIKFLAKVEEILKNENYKVTATIYDNKLLDLQGQDKSNGSFGLAIDIGTTTIAMYMINLVTGEDVGVISQVNKQRNYGADIISRINFTMEKDDGLDCLQKSIITQLNNMIDILCENNNVKHEHIYNGVIVGNTTMIHLLLGLPCKSIALAPYIPVTTEELNIESTKLGIKINGIISIVPGIASYVGSDIVSGILSSNLMNNDKYSLLLDLGTNGEMAIGNKEKIITCSTAAGPAFEGTNIKYGIGGVKGAICKVDLGKDRIYETIGDVNPIGICGSGVLDIVAQILKYNIMDETGRLLDEEEIDDEKLKLRFVDNSMKEFILAQNEDKDLISITQKDIREVQLAKAAISAGIDILLKEANLTFDDIENVYIGGGFGNFMNVQSCLEIGMIPKELKGKIMSIGNCAGFGAKKILLSQGQRKKANEIIDKCTYIELSKRQDFQEYFVDGMIFE
ncbi:ASKHA domain-containing protein [Terrisporobacter vanillatitrophus]|uniref:ASKHA domain-containing protein n=1 Tax=Terrisporobacter vanillatitrophus TaxID=3058402 RepID=UPI003369BD1D